MRLETYAVSLCDGTLTIKKNTEHQKQPLLQKCTHFLLFWCMENSQMHISCAPFFVLDPEDGKTHQKQLLIRNNFSSLRRPHTCPVGRGRVQTNWKFIIGSIQSWNAF